MKLAILATVLPLIMAKSVTQDAQAANNFLSSHKRVRRDNWLFDTAWETAKDQWEENKNGRTWAEMRELKKCTNKYDEAYEDYDENMEKFVEAHGNPSVVQPTKPVYNCEIAGQKIDLTQYAGQELF